MEQHNLLKIGITIGDINGIGPEVILKAVMDVRISGLCTPIVYGSSKVMSYYRKALNLGEFQFTMIKHAAQASTKQANMINVWEEEVKVEMGESTNLAGEKAFRSIELATRDLKEGKIDALVTAPINKKNIQSKDFNFAGHTEFFASKFEVDNYLMLMVSEQMRIGTVTGHIALSQVSASLTTEAIIKKIIVLNKSLKGDFSIRKPRIAVLGLNPHNGDNGLMGNEEQTIIKPAIEKAQADGILAFGPFPADGFFGSGAYTNYDGVLAMYHDQGLAPFKALAFSGGINYTAGLPVIRTSPDHGVGYDIAGKNLASEQSLREAIYMAIDIHRNRNTNKEISSNPLPIIPHQRERAGRIE
jgi:4-hydroxythreonine-4-phosphate dehydrogenase